MPSMGKSADQPEEWPFPWPAHAIAHYTAYRAAEPLTVAGRLTEPSWRQAPRSPRFVDLISGRPTDHDTRAAVLWDDEYLYVGYWIEEPNVAARLTERDSLIYTENDIELFVAGPDAYYELEINALGTVYEVFFVWDDAYHQAGFAQVPEFRRGGPGARAFNGVGFPEHPRGSRIGFWNWDLPGLRTAVHVDGSLNSWKGQDRGWTVEIALPWAGLQWLAGGRTLPPRDGDVWRMDFSRFNTYRSTDEGVCGDTEDSGGWAWSPHGVWDSHVPECFPFIHFSTETVGHGGQPSGKA